VLRTYGTAGLRDYIGHKAGLASHFAGLVRGDARFELTAPPRFGLVCFRAKVCATFERLGPVLLKAWHLASSLVMVPHDHVA
jgi:glutamate/tyrosine decarboxylase-like PLP-dependent enzyme